ncbi:MAG: periplasmic heavy metal sensor [Acidobacteriia bacterium]|nr:periplasmic heavy metal sensor [Terriglobia bacterium]
MGTYSAVRTLQNPKIGIAFTLVLVFLVGAVVGALAMNVGVHKGLHRVPFWTDSGKEISLHRLQKELDLTPEQTEQLKTALDDFSRYYQDVLAIGKTSIYKILNDEQKHKFDRLMNEPQK